MQSHLFNVRAKVIIVAGGAGYLGTPACLGLAAGGATVILADRDDQRLSEALDSIRREAPGAAIEGQRLDIADETAVRELIRDTVARHGRLDGVVNATFRSIGGPVGDLTAAAFDEANHVNITSAFVFAREAAGAMRGGGSMVMISSMYGIVSPDPQIYEAPMNPNPIEYGVGKAGLLQMVRYLAAAYGPRGIRVNAVAPGPFPFPSQQEAAPEFIKRLSARTMLRRIGRRDEVAGAIVFLLSDAASYITGHCLRVDGGWTEW